jgi:sec-independent protein translocase protein TatC
VKDSEDLDNTTAPLIEHLAELRTRLIWCIVAFAICMIGAFAVAQPIFNFLALPLMEAMRDFGQEPELIYTGLQQGFMVQVRISIFGGFVAAFPIIAYQLWRFVAPGLYRQEKRAFMPFLVASPVLFVMGAAFAYYAVLPLAFDFFLGFQQFGAGFGAAELETIEGAIEEGALIDEGLTVQFLGTINEYLGLTMQFVVAFGLCFQLPVLLTLMGKAGLVSAQALKDTRRYAIVGILVLAAIVTPPDVVTQVILFAVVYSLYEISIWLVTLVERQRERELRAAGLWDEETEAALREKL